MRLLLLTWFLACTPDNNLSERTDVTSPNWRPAIGVYPSTLDYGLLGWGESMTRSFTIRNEGDDHSTLHVADVYPASGDDFTLLGAPIEPFELRVNEEREVKVSFTANEPDDFFGEMMVASDDDEEPVVPVALLAGGTMPKLQVTPDMYSYGDVNVGCNDRTDFTLTNVGDQDLRVDSVLQDGAGHTMENRPVLPSTLAPGAEMTVTLGFAPMIDGSLPGTLVVQSSDPRGETSVPIAANGVSPGAQAISYVVPSVDALDLLVYVDQSVSMDDDQLALAANAEAFAAALIAMGRDVHVMVATSDDGCGTGGVLTPSSPGFAEQFRSAVLDAPAGVWTEAGLYVVQQAVRKTDEFMCNAGFLRSDALLHVIMISDEPDQSPVPWFDVVEELRTKKGSSHLLMMSAVIGPVPWGCYEAGVNSAEPGDGYYEATVETHGGRASLCDNWAPELNVIAASSITRDTFALVGLPDVATITVMVDGVRRTTGWHYMTDSNSIVFDADVPFSGQTVDITFFVPLSCG